MSEMFKIHYSEMVKNLKAQKLQLQQEIEKMPDGIRRSTKELKLKRVKIELMNYIEALNKSPN